MASEPRECGAEIVPGQKCPELATVRGTRHVYQKRELPTGRTEHVLMETHYDLVCPKCGNRTHVETHAPA